jgi:hypothetical protein
MIFAKRIDVPVKFRGAYKAIERPLSDGKERTTGNIIRSPKQANVDAVWVSKFLGEAGPGSFLRN